MKASAFGFQRAYRLTPIRGQADDVVSKLRIGGAASSSIVLLPYSSGLGYFVVPTAWKTISIETEDFLAETLDLPTSLWVRLRLALLFKKKKYLRFEEYRVLRSARSRSASASPRSTSTWSLSERRSTAI